MLPFSKFCMGVDLKKKEQQTPSAGNVVLDSDDLKEANSQKCSNSANNSETCYQGIKT